jgi:hypothetical protein
MPKPTVGLYVRLKLEGAVVSGGAQCVAEKVQWYSWDSTRKATPANEMNKYDFMCCALLSSFFHAQFDSKNELIFILIFILKKDITQIVKYTAQHMYIVQATTLQM